MARWGIASGAAIASLLAAGTAWAVSAEQYRQIGLSDRQQERYPEAIAAMQKAVELDPNNVSGRVLLGWTQHKAGNAAQSAKTLVQALQLNPFDVPALNALGIVYLVGGELPEAVAAHGWAALLKPDNEIAHYNLSLSFEQMGQYDWAIASAKEAARLEPSNPHPFVAQAIAHWGNRERSHAQKVYRQALSLDSRYGDPGFLNYLNEAGFSRRQIARSQQVLASLK